MHDINDERWRKVVVTHYEFTNAVQHFLNSDISRVKIMKQALRGPNRTTAIYLLPNIKVEELQSLFSELILLSSFSHGGIIVVRETVLRLPRQWVLDHIEEASEIYLSEGGFEEYRRFLELFILLDRDLTVRLARRASQSSDYDIREAGEDYLLKIGGE